MPRSRAHAVFVGVAELGALLLPWRLAAHNLLRAQQDGPQHGVVLQQLEQLGALLLRQHVVGHVLLRRARQQRGHAAAARAHGGATLRLGAVVVQRGRAAAKAGERGVAEGGAGVGRRARRQHHLCSDEGRARGRVAWGQRHRAGWPFRCSGGLPAQDEVARGAVRLRVWL
eukprot:1771616-Prymnesium_polylepis.1